MCLTNFEVTCGSQQEPSITGITDLPSKKKTFHQGNSISKME